MSFTSNRLSMVLCGLLLSAVVSHQAASAASVTLSADRDNMIWRTTSVANGQQLNEVNGGGMERFQVGTAGSSGTDGEVRSLISFDLSALPAYQSIDSITMRLYARTGSDISGETPFTLVGNAISAANKDWVEGTGLQDGGAGDNSGSTWKFKSEPGAVNWAGGTGTVATGGLTSPGVDYDVTTLFSTSFTTLPGDGDAVDFVFSGSSAQLTALIDGWQTDNGGILFRHDDPSGLATNKRIQFSSRDHSNSLLHPQLIIEFTEASVPIPEPSSLALLAMALCGIAKFRRKK